MELFLGLFVTGSMSQIYAIYIICSDEELLTSPDFPFLGIDVEEPVISI